MTPPTAPAAAIQAPAISGVLQLFDLDLSTITAGAPTLYFASDKAPLTTILRGGLRYWPVPLEVEGFDRGGTGAAPQPVLRVGDLFRMFSPWVWAGQDLVGAQVTRTVVLRDHLDDGADPDPTAFVLLDVYRIEQKVSHRPTAIEFQLIAQYDQGRRQLPGRQIIRDTCQHRYRVWNGSTWDYSQATCPYTGVPMFDVADVVTLTETEDLCSKKLKGCTLRFPGAPLPTTAFPGVGRS